MGGDPSQLCPSETYVLLADTDKRPPGDAGKCAGRTGAPAPSPAPGAFTSLEWDVADLTDSAQHLHVGPREESENLGAGILTFWMARPRVRGHVEDGAWGL